MSSNKEKGLRVEKRFLPGINRVTLLGNLGRDPEIRTREDERKMASLSLATSESWKDKETGQRRERTDWHQVVVYSEPLANLAETALKKGSRVYIEGQLFNRKWKDQNGEERQTNEVVLSPVARSNDFSGKPKKIRLNPLLNLMREQLFKSEYLGC
jgi:single stranded DNA-binding protein